jgi:arylsulfatase A-like enzyme
VTNVLWVVLDTARADAFEPYGAPAGASATVADLARRGAVAPALRSTACWTLPAHASMFAGGLPRALGLAEQAGMSPHSARPAIEALEDRLIATVLRRAGHSTKAVSANLWVSERCGFATGFDRFVETPSGRQARMASESRRARLGWALEVARARVDDGARAAEQVLHGWVAEQDRGQPFFWFANLVECHSPYLPPKPYSSLGVRGRLKAGADARGYLTQENVWRTNILREPPPRDALERMRRLYADAVRSMDDWLARLLEAMDARGLLDDTLVMVTSDHGENFGEGGLLAHAYSLDDRLLRLPLVAAGPGAETVAGARSLAELPALVAAAAGVAAHPYGGDQVPPLPVAQFDPPVPPPSDPRTQLAIERWSLDDEAVARMCGTILAVTDGRLKLVLEGDQERFYDLGADRLELRPLRAGEVGDASAVERLRAVLDHPALATVDPPSADAPAPAPDPSADELADLEERMRTLGYL